jgi:hypothetical protein
MHVRALRRVERTDRPVGRRPHRDLPAPRRGEFQGSFDRRQPPRASGWLVGGSSASTRGPDVKVGEAIAGVSFLEPHISRPWELQGSTNSR